MSGKVIYQIILCWFWNFRIGLALPGEKVMDIMDLFYMEYSVGVARERFWELLGSATPTLNTLSSRGRSTPSPDAVRRTD